MTEKRSGTKHPITLRRVLPLAAVLLLFALVFVAPTAAADGDVDENGVAKTGIFIVNEDGTTYYSSIADAIAAVEENEPTTINFDDGTYPMSTSSLSNKKVTFKGGKDAVITVFDTSSSNEPAYGASNSDLTFIGVTVKFDNNGYNGFSHANKVVYEECTHIGTQFLYAPTVVFSGCTFEMYDEKTEYSVWTYGAKDVTFTDCVFNTHGKAVLVYTEGTHQAEIKLDDCKFYSTGTFTNKAAVEVGQSANGKEAQYTININDCTATGFVPNNSDSSLWGNKDNMAMDNTGLTVEVTYTVTWVNDDGEVLDTKKVVNGTIPKYEKADPTKADSADGKYSYTFNGWTPTPEAITKKTTYTATYDEVLNTYTITWKLADGTTEETQVAYGEIPKYAGTTPIKANSADGKYSNIFNGWKPAVEAVTGAETYTAQFTEIEIPPSSGDSTGEAAPEPTPVQPVIPVEVVETKNDEGKTETTIVTSAGDNNNIIKVSEENNKVVEIAAANDEAAVIKVTFENEVQPTSGNSVTGVVEEVTISYKPSVAEAAPSETVTETIAYQMDLNIKTVVKDLPKIDSTVNETAVNAIAISSSSSNLKPIAMITATNVEAINEALADNGQIKLVFTVPGKWYESMKALYSFHVKNGEIVGEPELIPESNITPLANGDYQVTIYGDSFSTHGIAGEEKEEEQTQPETPTSGSSTPQGSSVWMSSPATSENPTTSSTTATVQNGGTATFSGSAVSAISLPGTYSGTVTFNPTSSVASPAGKDTYANVEISINPALPAGATATINFNVPLADLQAKGLSAADACLYHYGTAGWTPLLTTYTVTGDVVNYKATATEFSPFAIVLEKDGATADGQTAPTQTETESPGFGVLAVIAGLGAVAVLRRK